MTPKRSPRNSSGSKKSPRQSKGEKDSANDADAEARRKKEELARKVRERLKAKQAAEAAKRAAGSAWSYFSLAPLTTNANLCTLVLAVLE